MSAGAVPVYHDILIFFFKFCCLSFESATGFQNEYRIIGEIDQVLCSYHF
jgi:hypothetical protein